MKQDGKCNTWFHPVNIFLLFIFEEIPDQEPLISGCVFRKFWPIWTTWSAETRVYGFICKKCQFVCISLKAVCTGGNLQSGFSLWLLWRCWKTYYLPFSSELLVLLLSPYRGWNDSFLCGGYSIRILPVSQGHEFKKTAHRWRLGSSSNGERHCKSAAAKNT